MNWELLLTAIIAFVGFQQWRRELIGRRKADIAEKAIILSAKAKDAIEWARHPIGYAGEGESRPLLPGESEEKRDPYKDSLYAKIERLKANDEVFNELSEISYLFKAYFGDIAKAHFQAFNESRNRIYNTVWMMIRRGDDKISQELRDKQDKVIFLGYSEVLDGKDEISLSLESAVNEIERVCAPLIRGYTEKSFLESIKFWK